MFLTYFTPKKKRIKGQREERKKAKKATIETLINSFKAKNEDEEEQPAPVEEESKVSPKCSFIKSLLNYEPPSDSDTGDERDNFELKNDPEPGMEITKGKNGIEKLGRRLTSYEFKKGLKFFRVVAKYYQQYPIQNE
jgi:hypothetical protein